MIYKALIICGIVSRDRAKVPPEAANEVRDNDGHNNEADNLVNIEHDILHLDVLLAGLTAWWQLLHNVLETLNVDQFPEARQTEQSEQLRDLACVTSLEHFFERKDRYEVNEEPASRRRNIIDSNFFEFEDRFQRVRVNITVQKVEQQIEPEDVLEYFVEDHHRFIIYGFERDVVHGCDARVEHEK